MEQFIKNGEVKARNQIVIRTEEEMIICPNDETLAAHGWQPYVPVLAPRTMSPFEAVQNIVTKQFNERKDISNNEALEYMIIIRKWESYIGTTLEAGTIVVYDGKPWRIRQTHTIQSIYPPSLDTASLYEAIDKEHDGTLEDPIPYVAPMEIFEGKYYIQDKIVYKCIRNSETALTHNLSNLVNIYVVSV